MVTGEINSLEGVRLDSLRTGQSESLDLRCILSSSDLRFVCFDPNAKSIVRLGIINADAGASWTQGSLKKIFSTLKSQDQNIDSVKCFYSGVPFTLVPADLSEKSSNEQFLKVVQAELANDTQERVVADGNVKVVFNVPSFWKDELLASFPSAEVDILIRSQLNKALERGVNSDFDLLFAYQGSSFLELAAWKRAKGIVFANCFETGAAEDSLYFITNVVSSLGFNPETTTIILSGDSQADGILAMSLSKYFRHIEYPKLLADISNEGFSESLVSPILGWELCV